MKWKTETNCKPENCHPNICLNYKECWTEVHKNKLISEYLRCMNR